MQMEGDLDRYKTVDKKMEEMAAERQLAAGVVDEAVGAAKEQVAAIVPTKEQAATMVQAEEQATAIVPTKEQEAAMVSIEKQGAAMVKAEKQAADAEVPITKVAVCMHAPRRE